MTVYGIIYKCTNMLNGKIYIGQTTKSLKHRMTHHINDALRGGSYVFQKALRKYPLHEFSWEIIDECDSKDELHFKERYWIEYYNSSSYRENSNGYNLSLGGIGGTGWKMSDEELIENRLKQPHRKRIMQFEADGKYITTYNSHAEASRATGCDRSALTRCCREEEHHVRNYLWINEEDYSVELLNKKVKKYESRVPKKIVQCTINGNFIKIFDSGMECIEVVGGDYSSLGKCCRGKCKGVNKSHRGYKFYFYEDYLDMKSKGELP